jgi:hypothetical protein
MKTKVILISGAAAVVLALFLAGEPLWNLIYLEQVVEEHGLGHRVIYHTVRWGAHKGERHGWIRRYDREGTLLMSGQFEYDRWYGVSTTWKQGEIHRQSLFSQGDEIAQRNEAPWWGDEPKMWKPSENQRRSRISGGNVIKQPTTTSFFGGAGE